jgi:hypothetical protein
MMTTTEDIFDGFKGTMLGLEKGLQVIHITTPIAQLLCCQPDEETAVVLERPDIVQFDQIPVKKGESIIGLLHRREQGAGTTGLVQYRMCPLAENILVSAETSLLEFIQIDPLDRLVIRGTHIYGLVTRSDLLKLPVRLLAFALVTHVEAQILSLIQSTKIKQNVWLQWANNSKKIQKDHKKLAEERSDPDMLELTDFYSKINILDQLASLEEYASLLPPRAFFSRLDDVRQLRNALAHTGHDSDDKGNL